MTTFEALSTFLSLLSACFCCFCLFSYGKLKGSQVRKNDLEDLESRVRGVVKSIESEWEDVYEKMIRMRQRLDQRIHRDKVGKTEAEEGATPPALGPPLSVEDERAAIMRKVLGGGHGA